MNPIITGSIVAAVAALFAMIVWSVQRIVGRIDGLSNKVEAQGARTDDKLEALGTRVTIIETNQKATSSNVRKTARQVGVLPRDIEQTIDPRRVARA